MTASGSAPVPAPPPAPAGPAAFADAVAAHRRLIARVAASYARTPEDRRDLAQDILLQLWRAWPRFDPARAKLTTWMYRIALNVAISALRRPAAAAAARSAAFDDAVRAEPAALAVAPADPDDDRLERLYAAIATLAPLDRALVILHLDGNPHARIAEVLGLGESNVATKLSRLRAVLRARLTTGESP
jgi:RNA polymerase sigma-70 factor, ECF subfamily